MKIPASLIRAITVAVTVATITSSCVDDAPRPKDEKTEEQKYPDSCPGCGMG